VRFLLLLCADTSVAQSYELPGCEEWSREMADRGALVDAMGPRRRARCGCAATRCS
jgi:hypothetical protein